MNNLLPFAFDDQLFRALLRDGEPWFFHTDVCTALELSNAPQAATRLDDDEKSTITINDSGNINDLRTIINESGLWSLVLTSRKPAAKRFKKWITAEVLPSIRRTGSYLSPEAREALNATATAVLTDQQDQYLTLLRSQILLGVPPGIAARMAGKLCPAAPPEPRRLPSMIDADAAALDSIIDSMEEGRRYTCTELLAMLPRDHPARKSPSHKGQLIALGRLLEPARFDGRINRREERGGNGYYKVPRVVAFSAPT